MTYVARRVTDNLGEINQCFEKQCGGIRRSVGMPCAEVRSNVKCGLGYHRRSPQNKRPQPTEDISIRLDHLKVAQTDLRQRAATIQSHEARVPLCALPPT